MTKDEVDRMFGKGNWLPMPRFMHVQPNGKRRPIDDGKKYMHNQATIYTETMDCVTAVQPAIHMKVLGSEVRKKVPPNRRRTWKEAMKHLGVTDPRMESGTEDLPDAYRFVPGDPAENNVNVVGSMMAT